MALMIWQHGSSKRGLLIYCIAQFFFDFTFDEINGSGVFSTAGDHNISMLFRRGNVGHVHGAYGGLVLLDDRFQGSAAFLHIPLHSSNEANIQRCVNEHADVEQFANAGNAED